MTGLRLASRLARREVRRRPGRTALVALFVAVPVAAMVVSVVLVRTRTPDVEWERYNGSADAVYTGEVPRLPEGSEVAEVRDLASRRVRTAAGRTTTLRFTAVPLRSPLTSGFAVVRSGRLPSAAGEIALPRDALDDLDVGVGDRVRLGQPDLAAEVVGVAEQPSCLGCPVALVTDDVLDGLGGPVRTRGWVELPDDLGAATLDRLAARGVETASTSYGLRDGPELVRWTHVLGALVLTVVAIVIAAAFGVGARRQLVTLGQLSANGAPASTLRTALLLQGTWTGVVGAAAGLLLGFLVMWLGRGRLEELVEFRVHRLPVHTPDLLAPVVIGIVAATVAALLPAWTAARVPTLAALAGRRPHGGVPGRLVAAGVGGVAAGLVLLAVAVVGARGSDGDSGDVWVVLAVVGGVLVLLGACGVAPGLVAVLEPAANRLRGPWRLAARGLARNRTRTGAVVSAVAAAGALAIGGGALVLGAEEGEEGQVDERVVVASRLTAGGARPPGDRVRREVAAVLPEAEVYTVRRVDLPAPWRVVLQEEGGGSRRVETMEVAGPRLLGAYGVPAEVPEAMRRAGIVVVTSGGVRRAALRTGGDRPIRAEVVRSDSWAGGDVLVSPSMAEDLGLEAYSSGLLFRQPEPLTDEQRNRIADIEVGGIARTGDPGAQPFTTFTYRDPGTGPSPLQVELLLAGAALLFAVLVIGTGLALAAAEGRDERDVLAVVGAAPSSMAKAAGASAVVLALLGTVLAVPVGLLPVGVFTLADEGAEPSFAVPVRTVLLLVLVVPVVVGLVAAGASAVAQRVRPLRVSALTLDWNRF